MENEPKKIMLSGIQPTGIFTLGNYIGAVRNWSRLQDEFQNYYFIADLHSLTVRVEPAKLRKQSMDAFMLLLACGIDPEKSLMFFQSHVPAHAEMAWILMCYSQFGELSRMTQFKDKSASHPDNINAGLFTYPSLMAADILLYEPDFVPVGVDQRQHLELTRDVAARFNNLHGDVFKIPEGYYGETGSKVMSLQDPIVNKFKRAVTDSETEVAFREGKDGINNLMVIYSNITGLSLEEIAHDFAGKGYGDFKKAVGEAVVEELRPIQEKFADLEKNKDYVEAVYKEGAERANRISSKTLFKVKKKCGLVPKAR